MSHPKARIIFVALAATWLVAGTAAAESVGFLAVARGDVQVQRYGTNSFEVAIQDADVEVGDTIRTGLDSQAKVILADDTTLSIDEDTEITIQSLHVGAAATRDRSIIRQTRGRLRTVVGSAFGGQTNLEVHTPTAVVGVKGTDVITLRDDRGQLTGRDKDKGQWIACLNDGQIVVRARNGVATPPPRHCVITYSWGDVSEPLLNTLADFSVAFTAPTFNTGDFVAYGGPGVGEGPPGGGGGGDGYGDGTGSGGGGGGGSGDGTETLGGDEINVTSGTGGGLGLGTGGTTDPPVDDGIEIPSESLD